jgi:hypothetical protein
VATARTSKPRAKLTAISVGLKHGFRSGLEETLAAQLQAAGVPFEYEAHKLAFEEPPKKRHYTPDFHLPNGIVIETKGRFLTADRQKHLLVKAQHPDLDLRFVFSNSKAKISKRSTTTYADWCVKHGFLFADKAAPAAWLKEPK